jgi:ppGpp synthetase/RelA/SpoT-type nucleotidyltranferase
VPLGVRLGITISLVVVLTLGTLTMVQQRREISWDRKALEALMADSLLPARLTLAAAATVEQLRARVGELDHAYGTGGWRDHQITLKDDDGEVIAASPGAGADATAGAGRLVATVTITSPALPSGRGTLTLVRDASRFATNVAARWRMWLLDLVVTAACIVASLLVAMYVQLTRPLRQLVDQLRRAEAGYLGDIGPRRGAWEIRWLGWQWQRLVAELSESARRLVWAERRADDPAPAGGSAGASEPATAGGDGRREKKDMARDLLRRYLRDRCRLLESLDPRDPASHVIAEAAWSEDTVEAARLGDMHLRARLDNAALRLLDPETFAAVEREVSEVVAARNGWAQRIANDLGQALRSGGTPFIEIQHRVKHVAGVWRKMRARSLSVADVQDLFAFRVIVPEETYCYHALRAVHQRFEPEPFRFKDYIVHPKGNGYRSLHTCVRDHDDTIFEVQIRSIEMHTEAERGSSAHWRYMAGKDRAEGRLHGGVRTLRRWLPGFSRPAGPTAGSADDSHAAP